MRKLYSATGRDVHIDVPLSQIAIAYRPTGMIVDMVAPIVPVNKQSDGFFIWDVADAFRIEDDKRAPSTEANIITRRVSSDTYYAKNYALKDRVPYEDIENADQGYIFAERQTRAEYIKDKLMLSMELRVANKVTSSSNVGSSSNVSSQWTDLASGNSDPIGNINTALNDVQDRTGYRPNRIVFGNAAWRNFKEHADVIGRVYGTLGNPMVGARIIQKEHAKAIFEVEDVLVGGAYRNTTEEGQTHSLSAIWGDHVLVYYAPMRARKDVPSFMYAFRWKKVMDMNVVVRQRPEMYAEEVELGFFQDEKITASALSFLIKNVNSSQ